MCVRLRQRMARTDGRGDLAGHEDQRPGFARLADRAFDHGRRVPVKLSQPRQNSRTQAGMGKQLIQRDQRDVLLRRHPGEEPFLPADVFALFFDRKRFCDELREPAADTAQAVDDLRLPRLEMRVQGGHKSLRIAARDGPQHIDGHAEATRGKGQQHLLDHRARGPARIACRGNHADRVDREHPPVQHVLCVFLAGRRIRLVAKQPVQIRPDVGKRHRVAHQRHHVQALDEDLLCVVADRFERDLPERGLLRLRRRSGRNGCDQQTALFGVGANDGGDDR